MGHCFGDNSGDSLSDYRAHCWGAIQGWDASAEDGRRDRAKDATAGACLGVTAGAYPDVTAGVAGTEDEVRSEAVEAGTHYAAETETAEAEPGGAARDCYAVPRTLLPMPETERCRGMQIALHDGRFSFWSESSLFSLGFVTFQSATGNFQSVPCPGCLTPISRCGWRAFPVGRATEHCCPESADRGLRLPGSRAEADPDYSVRDRRHRRLAERGS